MANEFVHESAGIELTQIEDDAVGRHKFNSQATGDILYASSGSQLSRLGIGSTDQVLSVVGGIPAWASGVKGMRNAIINGIALVNQRVTAHTLVKDVYGICADRFYGMATGTAVSAGTLATTAGSGSQPFSWFYFGGMTLTGTGVIYLRYRMEAKDAARFKGQTASFRCQVLQDTGGAINYTIYVRKANAADNFAAVTAISDSGAISVPNSTVTSLPYLAIAMGECGNGIEIEIKVECGAVTTKGFYFTQLQLELGSVATPFEYRPYGQELALCQRYYEKSYDGASAPGTVTDIGSIYVIAQSTYELYFPITTFRVTKRILPTITVYSTGTGASAKFYDVTAAGDVNAFAADRVGQNSFRESSNNTLTAGNKYAYHWVAVSEL